MFTYDPRPSPVDASFLEKLTQEQMSEERLIMIFDLFQYFNNTRWFEIEELPRQRNLSRLYRFDFLYDSMSVSIRLGFYWYEQVLIDYLPSMTRHHDRRFSTVITNDNNTQAFLHASFNPRSHGAPASWRSIWTELRLGNVHITMYESRDRNNVYPNASTAFIQLLYELLTANE